MKIGMISDIHVDINSNYNVKDAICKVIEEEEIECLVIAGDISNSHEVSLATIDYIIRETGIKLYFVPGNHDMWDEKKEYNNSYEIYNKLRSHPSCLSGESKVLNEDWVIIGDIGWYDYTFGNKKYSKEEFEKMHAFERTWQDSIFVNWEKSNEEMHKFFLNRLETEIKKYASMKKILVTHMVSRKEFVVQDEFELWRYFNAFLGSEDYGNLYEKYKIEYALMGHVHYRKYFEHENTKYICSCLSYSKEWKKADNFIEEIRESMYIMNI